MKNTASHLIEVLELSLQGLRLISDEKASVRPAPGKWSAKEIIGHLTDSAANNHQKFVRTILEDGVRFVGYAQDGWVATQHYNEESWEQLLLVWEHYNRHLAHIMQHIPAAALEHEIFIDGKGPFTLAFIVKDYLEHLKHHMEEILPAAHFTGNEFRMIY